MKTNTIQYKALGRQDGPPGAKKTCFINLKCVFRYFQEKEKDTTNINSHEGNGDLNQTTKAGGSKRGNVLIFS